MAKTILALLTIAVAAMSAAAVPVLVVQPASPAARVVRVRQPLLAAEARVRPSSPAAALAANLLDEAASSYPISPYNFGYDVRDEFGNHQYRKEESDERGVVRGTYGYTDAAGLYRYVDYVADASGFKANIRSNEPGVGGAQPANVVLVSEEPPRSVIELASAPRPQTRRLAVPRDQAASERVRYSVPLPVASEAGVSSSSGSRGRQ